MTARIPSLIATAALAGATLFTAPASAGIQRNLQLDVQYDASALGTASGAETVLKSLQDQATAACSYVQPVAGAPRVDDVCVSDIVAKAVRQIGHPELTRVYAANIPQATRVLASLD